MTPPTQSDPTAVRLDPEQLDRYLATLGEHYALWAPRAIPDRGRFFHQEVIRYGRITRASQIARQRQSDFAPKEVVFPPNEVLFYQSADQWQEPELDERPILLFLRACDIHGLDRVDRIYLQNGDREDPYYARRRKQVHIALMECTESFENCFCVSMGTNKADGYVIAIRFLREGGALALARDAALAGSFPEDAGETDYEPAGVSADRNPVALPDQQRLRRAVRHEDIFDHPLWDEYDHRCIACGRCNTSCPTCTCFTTVDSADDAQPDVGHRRRTYAACHVDRFTDMAGGHTFRQKYGSRMRFKTLHKIYDYKERFGVHMCVGCGRCDDQCPEYISLGACTDRLTRVLHDEDSDHD